jgi:hypothetical protein
MSVLLRKQYSTIKKEKLSEQAKSVLKSMYDTTDGFKDLKATRKIKPKFEAFYNKLKESKPEAIVGGKTKSKAAPKKSADDFKAARARRKPQSGVPKDKKAVDKDATRPAISKRGRRVSKAGNTYYEYRDNRFDKNPSKYPMLEKGGYTNVDFSNGNYIVKAWQTKEDYENGNSQEVGKFKNIHDAHLLVDDYLSPNKFEWYAAEIYDGNDGETLYNSEDDGYTEMDKGGYMAKGGKVKNKFMVLEKVYSYQNKDYPASIAYVRFVPYDSVDFRHPNDKYVYKLELKDGYSNWINEESLHKTKQKEYANGGYMAKGGELDEKYEIELFFKGLSGDDRKIGKYVITQKTLDRLNEYLGGDWSEAISLDVIDESDKKPTSWADLKNDVYDKYAEKFHKKEKGGYMAKGGETKVPNTYIPNRDVQELMIVLKEKSIKLKGSDILDGVYAKNSALGAKPRVSRRSKDSKSTSNAQGVYDAIIEKSKKYTGVETKDLDIVKTSDIQSLLDVGYNEKEILAIYLGADAFVEIKSDTEFAGTYYPDGIFSLNKESIDEQLNRFISVAKNKQYELGLKYPNFNWKAIIKKYDIKNEPVLVERKRNWGDNEEVVNTYEVFVGDKVVLGHQIKTTYYKNGKVDRVYDDSETAIKNYNNINKYQKDRDYKAGFNGGYWGVVSSQKEVIETITKDILSQKGGYVKDLEMFVNRLGGVGYEELDASNIKYEHGGYMADGGDLASEFSIEEMKKHLDNEFPDSFGFKLFPIKNGTSFEPDYDAEVVKGRATKGLSDYDLKPKKLMFPMYKRDHAINYNVTEGGENTYFDFLLSDTDGDKYYSGTFGFKDQGDVSPDYITKFIAFLMKSYGLPFKVNHSVYAKGGEVNKVDYMMLDRLRSDNEYYLGNGNRNPKNLWAGSVDGQIEEMKKLWNQLPKDKKPEWLSMEDIENYERKMKGDKMAHGGETHRLDSIFEDGGEIAEGNLEMAMSNVKAIGHHAQELKGLLNEDTSIEAWVVAKLERAETDLSDVTHYIDGLKGEEVESDTYFARGGLTKDETLKVAEKYAEALSKSENKKVTVNTRTLEEDSFDLDMDGIEYDGGSYNIYDNGDVKNMALSESPVYGKATYTVDEILINQYSGSTKMAEGGSIKRLKINYKLSPSTLNLHLGRYGSYDYANRRVKNWNVDDFKSYVWDYSTNDYEISGTSSKSSILLKEIFVNGKLPVENGELTPTGANNDEYYKKYKSSSAVVYDVWAEIIKQNNLKPSDDNEIIKEPKPKLTKSEEKELKNFEELEKNTPFDIWISKDSPATDKMYDNNRELTNKKNLILDHEGKLEKGGMMAKGGRLSRKQKQLDLNKNGKLDSQDFKMLRAGRKNARKK